MPPVATGAPANSNLYQFVAPRVETQTQWGSDWYEDPDLYLISCALNAGPRASQAQVQRRYGNIVNIEQASGPAFVQQPAYSVDSTWWVRISVWGNNTWVIVFVGNLDNEARKLQGTPATQSTGAIPAGAQDFVCSGGWRILEKITISEAVFSDAAGNLDTVQWIPAMNARDKRGLLVGNQSQDTPGPNDTYCYGDTAVWTHLEYLQYVLANFVNQPGAPQFTLTGQIDILDKISTSIRFPEACTAAEMLKLLCPVKYGVDFAIVPASDGSGFHIQIFALNGAGTINSGGSGAGGVSMPTNPLAVTIDRTTDMRIIEAKLVSTSERKVDRVEVLGKRITVCGTLYGKRSIEDGTPTLVPRWSAAIETDYKSAGGKVGQETDPELLDGIRKAEKYRDVYQHFGAPAAWDLNGGSWAVACKDDGSLTTGDYQTAIRETLSWIPLKEGFDYSTDPPTDLTLGGMGAGGAGDCDVKPLVAWIKDEDPASPQQPNDGDPAYVVCNKVGIHLSHPHDDWGIFINPSPNHKVALNHWAEENIATSVLDPLPYDYETLVATIAIESDHRLQLAYQVPAQQAAGDGSVKTIIDEQAELWVMLPNTIVDVDTVGAFIKSGGKIRKLRDDTQRLALILSGEVARYVNDRAKAQIVYKGHMPWPTMLAQILTLKQAGDISNTLGAAITSIEWLAGVSNPPTPPTTIFRTGYA